MELLIKIITIIKELLTGCIIYLNQITFVYKNIIILLLQIHLKNKTKT